jgi:hypothetical protein
LFIQPSEIHQGDILIGHALLMNAALLLDKKVRLDEGRLLDFCTLINALTLHDRLVTLPSIIPKSLKNSSFYKYLKSRKILYDLKFDFSYFSDEEKLEIEDLFGTRFSENDANLVLGKLRDEYGNSDYLRYDIKKEDDRKYHQRSRFIDGVINRRPDEWSPGNFALYAIPVEDIPGSSILPPPHNRDKEFLLHFLRTAGYWEISGKLNLAFLPDFMRIPIISGYNARLRQSLRTFISAKVDELVRSEVEAAMGIAVPMPVPIPNAISNFLFKYSETSTMEDAFDSIRDEFAEDRSTIIKWEEKMRKSDKNGYKESLEVMEEIASSLSAITKSDKGEIVVSATAGVASDMLEMSLHKTLGLSTAEFAVREGLTLIRRWRQRARISYFNTGKKDAANVRNQNELFKNAFGISLTPRQIDRFSALADSLDKLTQPLSRRA